MSAMSAERAAGALCVPIEVFALPVSNPLAVADLAHNFDATNPRLNPWLGQNTEPHPFTPGPALQPGVHLHWALPEALTHGRVTFSLDASVWATLQIQGFPGPLAAALRGSPGFAAERDFATRGELEAALAAAFATVIAEQGVAADALARSVRWVSSAVSATTRFPSVPNRWKVTRFVADGDPVTWLVESDSLRIERHVPGDPCSAQNVLSPTIPVAPTAVAAQPFRYLGRVFEASAWREDTTSERHSPMTALGYGHPAFAATLASCYNVFGLFDPLDATLRSSDNTLRYEVVGWYSDPEVDDPLGRRDAADATAWASAAAWALPGPAGTTAPHRTVLLGRLDEVPWSPHGVLRHASGPIAVAVGNSAAEALSALLSRRDRMRGLQDVERYLNALQLGLLSSIEPAAAGALKQFDDALHQQQFSPLPGGLLWTVKQGAGNALRPDPTGDLPLSVAHRLNELNIAQSACNRIDAQIDAMRSQLFADWCNTQLMRPGDGTSLEEQTRYVDELALALAGFGNALDALDALERGPGDTDRIAAIGRRDTAHAEVVAAVDGEVVAIGAARFWQPNEPVVVLEGEDARPLPPQLPFTAAAIAGSPAMLQCSSVDEATWLQLVDASASAAWQPNPAGLEHWQQRWQASWRPLMLQWSVEFHEAQTGDYPPGVLLGNGGFDTAHPTDLAFAPLTLNSMPDVYTGAVVIAAHADRSLREQAAHYLATHPLVVGDTARTAIRADLEALLTVAPLAVRSQALSGFNAALLSRRQCLQLPVLDPHTDRHAQSIGDDDIAQIAAGVGERNDTAVMSDVRHQPLRSGHLALVRLWLVDAFGQVAVVLGDGLAEVGWNNPRPQNRVLRAEAFVGDANATNATSSDSRVASLLALRPRLAQATRLAFRWLSADDDQVEMNSDPASSPIVGWVMVNRLEQRLDVFDAGGEALGSLNETGTTWQSAPGTTLAFSGEPAIGNAHLAAFVRATVSAAHDDPNVVPQLITVIDDMTDHVLPRSHAQHTGIGVLMGRPLALVRASLNLEVQGERAPDQSLGAFRQWLNGHGRADRAVGTVRVPVRLGHKSHLNDGLVGFFIDQAGGYDTFFVEDHEGGETGGSTRIRAPRIDDLSVSADDDASVRLTLLIDPRAPLHATTGVLPVKQIEVPSQMIEPALRRMRVTFPAAPVFTRFAVDVAGDAAALSSIAIPPPGEPGFVWSFLNRRPAGWQESKVTPVDRTADLAVYPQQLVDGWLQLRPAPEPPPEPPPKPPLRSTDISPGKEPS